MTSTKRQRGTQPKLDEEPSDTSCCQTPPGDNHLLHRKWDGKDASSGGTPFVRSIPPIHGPDPSTTGCQPLAIAGHAGWTDAKHREFAILVAIQTSRALARMSQSAEPVNSTQRGPVHRHSRADEEKILWLAWAVLHVDVPSVSAWGGPDVQRALFRGDHPTYPSRRPTKLLERRGIHHDDAGLAANKTPPGRRALPTAAEDQGPGMGMVGRRI